MDPYGSMTASIAADYLIPMAIFTMFMAVLYANYAYEQIRIISYLSANISILL